MERRELLAISSAALLLSGGRAQAQSATTTESVEAKVVRVFATADGGSRVAPIVSENLKSKI